MYTFMRPYLSSLTVPDWLPVEKNEALPHYAERIAETFPHDEPLVLGGHSFGGILAQEVARLVKPKMLYLMSTARSHTCIARESKLLERLLYPLPLYLIDATRQAFGLMGPVLRMARGMSAEQAAALCGMITQTPLDICRAGARWATTFGGCGGLDDIPTFSVHGDRDHIFPIKLVKPDLVIERGTHIIPVTHAKQVAEFLNQKMRQTMPGMVA